MGDFQGSTGEIIFTFDGDAAGQAAALKVFAADEEFHSPTYVAVAPDGLDPNDLRMAQGDAAVRELIDGRKPLYEFVLRNVVGRYDLNRADGRVEALREAAQLVSAIRDKSKVTEFARELAGMVGVDTGAALAAVRRAGERSSRTQAPATQAPAPAPAGPALPDPRDPRLSLEREVLKALLQQPVVIGSLTASIGPDDFTHPAYRAVWALMAAAGGVVAGAGDEQWVTTVQARCTDDRLVPLVTALAVEPIRAKDAGAVYVREVVSRLREATIARRIAEAHSRLQRADPSDLDGYFAIAGEVAALEQERRALRDDLVS
jgi:DNA primase